MKTPQQLNLPSKFTEWRPGQGELVGQISDSEAKLFLLDAPPGTGKSLIAVAVHQSRVMSEDAARVMARLTDSDPKDFDSRCVFVTETIQLQQQILAEFPDARTMEGRRNFSCLRLKPKKTREDITAEDCTNTKDSPCPHHPRYIKVTEEMPERGLPCPYNLKKMKALKAPIAVLNTSYLLREINGPGGFSGSELMVIDEFDAVEGKLMDLIKLEITSKQLANLGISLPADPHSLQGWMIWASGLDLEPRANTMAEALEEIEPSFWSDVEIGQHKTVTKLKAFQIKVAQFTLEVNDSWIFSEQQDQDGVFTWTFKPVKVDVYAEQYLWKHAERFLGMSGTILSPDLITKDLGISDWDYTQSQSPFPLDNRPIYYTPRAKLTAKTMDAELPHLVAAVADLIELYADQKILVHTTTNYIRRYLLGALPVTLQGRLMTHDETSRAEMLEQFKRSTEPKVMISPSFNRGVDLPDDLCRCIIICKVPYIGMGDPQVKARMSLAGGELWYNLKAVQTIVQMSGRGVRNELDYCDTYILDRQFGSILARMGRYFPQWWKDALVK